MMVLVLLLLIRFGLLLGRGFGHELLEGHEVAFFFRVTLGLGNSLAVT